MPYCSKCGSLVGERDGFCSRCGQVLVQPPNQQNRVFSSIPLKPSTNLVNGIFIGLGSALIIVGLIIAFSVNDVYYQQIKYLSLQGIQVNIYGFGLTGLVQLVTLGAFMAELGAYVLILGSVNQFSVTVRAAMDGKDSSARLGSGLISGGFVLSALTTSNFIEQYYHPTSSGWYTSVWIGFAVVGLSLILAGALLIRSSYLRSCWPTKV
jgi:hypothetical protein